MTHLSALVLDEAAAGLPLDTTSQAHLSACPECKASLERLKASNAQLLASAAAQRVLSAVVPAAPPRLSRRLALVGAVLAVAAGVTVWVTAPAPLLDEPRLKGTPEVALLTAEGRSVARAAPGQSLDLALGGAGHSHASVFAVDASGAVSTLFSGALHGGAREKVAHLDVTPGDVLVLAFFADDLASLSTHEPRVRAALTSTATPLEVAPPGATRLRLEVKPSP